MRNSHTEALKPSAGVMANMFLDNVSTSGIGTISRSFVFSMLSVNIIEPEPFILNA